MGLFNFFKNSKKKEKESNEPEVNPQELLGIVNGMGMTVSDLSLSVDDDKVTVYGECESQADKEKIILALGNQPGVASVDDRMTVKAPAPEAKFYEVKSGDSLSKIAQAEYGDPMKYTIIFEANKPMLKNPDMIFPGQQLRIPPLEG